MAGATGAWWKGELVFSSCFIPTSIAPQTVSEVFKPFNLSCFVQQTARKLAITEVDLERSEGRVQTAEAYVTFLNTFLKWLTKAR